MGAQGWHRDPFSLHEGRWFSAGLPTRLVRDQGAESYDEPPPGEPTALSVFSDEAGAGQSTRARLVSGRSVPAGAASGVADFANLKPAPNWRYWTVLPPCLLALALAVLATLGLISSAASGPSPGQEGAGSFAPGTGNLVGWSLLREAGLIVAVVAAIVVACVAADQKVNRRACALAGWVIAALAYGWALLIALLASVAR